MSRQESTLIDLGAAIEDGLYESDATIDRIAEQIEQWLIDAHKPQTKACEKIARKINGSINRQLTVQANGIDHVVTQLLTWISGQLATSEWTLTGIAVKAGCIQAGLSLDAVVWDQEPACSLGPEYGGTLILDCRGLGEQLAPFLEVLREIRDRMGGVAVKLPGEPASKEEDEDAGTSENLPVVAASDVEPNYLSALA